MADKGKEEESSPEAASADLKEMLGEVLGVLQNAQRTELPEDVNPDEMLHDLEDTIAKLSERAEEMRKMTGLSKEELEHFAENPDNFTKDEWKLLSDIKGELHRYEEEADKIFAEPFPELEGAEEEPKKPGKRKPKRKGWMRG